MILIGLNNHFDRTAILTCTSAIISQTIIKKKVLRQSKMNMSHIILVLVFLRRVPTGIFSEQFFNPPVKNTNMPQFFSCDDLFYRIILHFIYGILVERNGTRNTEHS